MFFDGECDFCKYWVARWQRSTGQRVEFVPFQSGRVTAQLPQLPYEKLRQTLHLIEPNGAIYTGAEAVFHALALNPKRRIWLWLYQRVPGFAKIAEWCYRFIANHRAEFSALTRVFLRRG